ncbi:MAG: methyltransferase domain-containing protein, partial [Anaerolineaceae bacterium]|nr:methyltransferase domain-containing protein [Anaerolineaceae bacterium]
FREGLIEELPVEDASVDLVISNCVVNLSPDKPQVFREVARVLKPGGRLVISDLVLNRELPEPALEDESLLCACIGGASLRQDYLAAIQSAGLERIEILTDSTYRGGTDTRNPVASDAAAGLEGCASSITVRAFKPAACHVGCPPGSARTAPAG